MATKKRLFAVLATCALPLSSLCGRAAAQEPVEVPQPFAVRLPDGFGGHSFWIGAMCVPVDPALRAQLNLKDHEGLLVSNIMPESPAAKAGLKQFDVVTAIDGNPLNSLHALMKAVGDAGEKELKLDILRGGKKESVAVTPAKRPDRDTLLFNAPLGGEGPLAREPRRMQEQLERLQQQFEQMRERLPEGEVKRMEEWLERMRRGENQPFRMQMFGPGVVMQPVQLPPGVSVSINRKGNEPAQIVVKRGEESWQVTEKELDKLPVDLRGPIASMLANKGTVMFKSTADGAAVAAATAGDGAGNVQIEIKTDEGSDKQIVVGPGTAAGGSSLTDEVARLRKQVEALQRQIDGLKQTPQNPAEPLPPQKEKSQDQPKKKAI